MASDDIKELVAKMSTSDLLDVYLSRSDRADDSDDSGDSDSDRRAFLAGYEAGVKRRAESGDDDTNRMGDHGGKKKKRKDGDGDDDDMDDDDTDSKKAMDDDEMKEKAAALADERADLLILVRDLLPKDFVSRGKTNVEILVAAVGEEVKDADKRSADYLMAKVEAIVERRAAANNRGSAPGGPAPHPMPANATIDVTRHLKRD